MVSPGRSGDNGQHRDVYTAIQADDRDDTPDKDAGDETDTHRNLSQRREDSATHQEGVCRTVTDGDVKLSEEDAYNAVPIDTGWAWAILLGAVISVTITIGILKSVGILFVEFQEKFSSSSSMTSLLSTVQNAMYSISALVVMTVGMKRFSCRQLVIFGSIVMSSSYVITSRADDIRILFLSYGVLHGFGLACIQPCALVMVGLYFDKRRGFANSIAISGGSLGGLILAPLLTTMFDYYGYFGCFLVVAGIVLHCCISAVLYRSPSFFTDMKRAKRNPLLERSVVEENEIDKQDNPQNAESSEHGKPSNIMDGEPNGDVYTFAQKTPLTASESVKMSHMKKANIVNDKSSTVVLLNTSDPHAVGIVERFAFRDRSNTEPSKRFIDVLRERQLGQRSSSEYMAGSMLDIPVLTLPSISKSSKSEIHSKQPHTLRTRIWKWFSDTFDVHLVRNPVFIMFALAAGLLCSSTNMTVIFLAPYAAELGVSKNKIAQLLQVYSAIDICVRIGIGYISDKGFIRRSTIIGIATVICGVFAFLLRFFVTFQWLMFYAVMLGIFSGVYFALFAAVIVDYLTVAKLQSSIGFTILSHGASISATFSIMGYLRDVSGSYVLPYGFLGTTSFLGAGVMFALPFVERVYSRRMKADAIDINIDS